MIDTSSAALYFQYAVIKGERGMKLILALGMILAMGDVDVLISAPRITSFGSNGQLTWTDSATSCAYRVEWASSMTSEWNATWTDLSVIPSCSSGGTYTVNVPMFFRVARLSVVSTSEIIGVGDGNSIDFRGSLGAVPLVPRTLTIQATMPGDDSEIFADDGKGLLNSSNLANATKGSIDYQTGAYSVQFMLPPLMATPVLANYLVIAAPSAPAGMALIPAGINTGTDPDVGAYSLTNTMAFYMDKYEVTKAKWDEVYNWANGSGYVINGTGAGKATNHPVQSVSWYDCVKWCNARSDMEGREPAYYGDEACQSVYGKGAVSGASAPYEKAAANGYRLPSSGQWEFAARGGAQSHRFPWSDSDSIQHARANYFVPFSSEFGEAYDTSPTRGYHPSYTNQPEPYTSPVGSFPANGYGLHDMAGNVFEWCFDWFPGSGGDGGARTSCGGCWSDYAGACRVSFRSGDGPNHASNYTGFRTVLP